jgi:hypothetical protein
MTKLKTLKDFDPEPCCHGINQRELKQEAIKWAKEQNIFCSCGAKCIPHYEGEAICPIEEELIYKSKDFPNQEEWHKVREQHQTSCSYSELAVFDFIVEFFNLNEEECK